MEPKTGPGAHWIHGVQDRTWGPLDSMVSKTATGAHSLPESPRPDLEPTRLHSVHTGPEAHLPPTRPGPDLGPTGLHGVQDRNWGPLASRASKTGPGAHLPPKRPGPDLKTTRLHSVHTGPRAHPPPTLLIRGALSYSAKWRRRETDHQPPSSTQARYPWSPTPTPYISSWPLALSHTVITVALAGDHTLHYCIHGIWYTHS